MTLKELLVAKGITPKFIAHETGLSSTAVHRIVNHLLYPQRGAAMLQQYLENMLQNSGATDAEISTALQLNITLQRTLARSAATKQKAQHAFKRTEPFTAAEETAAISTTKPTTAPTEEVDMLPVKVSLTQAAKQYFKLPRDPFTNDVQDAKDVFLTPEIRYVRETLWDTAKHGGAVAVTCESGGGKSTIRRDLVDRILRDQPSIIVMSPSILAMEENDIKGKTLKSAAISEVIITSLDPQARPMRSFEARSTQMTRMLKDSYRRGNRHVLMIEEAHGMPTATLKHLKRFYEIEDGFKSLLSIILIGQSELRDKLTRGNPEVREVAQRFEILELPALDNHFEAYLTFKFSRIGVDITTVLDKAAIQAIRTKLSPAQTTQGRSRAFGQPQYGSMLYPLAIANVVSAAMNEAASLGVPLVTADVVKGI
jgi:type II secretory pathway predicted ATPase ExeA